MPPPLALAFCAIFIILMLRLERKQAPDVTRALWIPTVWMLYSASKPIAVWFRIESTAPDAGSPMDQVFLIGLMLAALAILARRRSRWMGAMKENPWVLALIVFMLISVIWSDIPGTSLKRWIRELHAVLMSLAVLSEPSPRQAMESLLRRVTYILIPLSMLLIKYFPIYGVEYGRWSGEQMWIGVTQQKNGMALLCIISAIFILWSLFRRWQGETPPV
ncbi:MAG: Lipid core - O-antigen ligase, partial [Candidatus Aminicenantes bacterium]|nr:Lipid core - O-antigen ligase [Candidatus Aminicenantes bacterium]